MNEVELNVTLKGVDRAIEKANALLESIKAANSAFEDLAEAMKKLSTAVEEAENNGEKDQ